MSQKTKIIIWIVVIAVAVAGFVVWDSQRDKGPQTTEEIEKEIDRLQDLIRQLEEDTKKVEEGEVSCVLIYAPVCGADGRTYSNDCFASAAGVEVEQQGECR